jgi:hypothetical protein
MSINPVKSFFLILFIAAAAMIPAGAATISIMIIETGMTDESAKRTADIWESGMMDAFFDEGHIVCNTPAIQIPNLDDEELPKEARRNFEDADINGVDYFVIAQLNYSQNGSSVITGPDKVSLKLYRVSPYSILYKTSFPANSGIPASEEFSGAKNAARMLLTYIKGGL